MDYVNKNLYYIIHIIISNLINIYIGNIFILFYINIDFFNSLLANFERKQMGLDLESLTEDQLVMVMDKCCDNIERLNDVLDRLKNSRSITLISNTNHIKKQELVNEYNLLFLDAYNELTYTKFVMDKAAELLGLKGLL